VQEINLLSIVDIIKRWKLLLIMSVIILSTFSVTISLIVPLTYSSSASIIPPGSGGLLDSFLPASMTRGLGGLISGSSSDPNNGVNKTISILNSRELAVNTISEFGLMDHYGSATIEDAINSFRGDFSILLTSEGMVNISFRQKTEYFHPDENEASVRQRVQKIAQFIIDELDKKYTYLETQKARYQRIIIERRYNESLNDIADLENEIMEFSSTNGILNFELQIEAQLEALYKLESELINAEVKYQILLAKFDESNQQVVSQKNIVNTLLKKIEEIKIGESETNLQTSIYDAPEIGRRYLQLQRDMLVQTAIYEFVVQQFEQIKIQEAKDTPSLQFIDTPQEPTKRTSPRRSLMVIALCAVGFFIVLAVITAIEFFERSNITLKQTQQPN